MRHNEGDEYLLVSTLPAALGVKIYFFNSSRGTVGARFHVNRELNANFQRHICIGVPEVIGISAQMQNFQEACHTVLKVNKMLLSMEYS